MVGWFGNQAGVSGFFDPYAQTLSKKTGNTPKSISRLFHNEHRHRGVLSDIMADTA